MQVISLHAAATAPPVYVPVTGGSPGPVSAQLLVCLPPGSPGNRSSQPMYMAAHRRSWRCSCCSAPQPYSHTAGGRQRPCCSRGLHSRAAQKWAATWKPPRGRSCCHARWAPPNGHTQPQRLANLNRHFLTKPANAAMGPRKFTALEGRACYLKHLGSVSHAFFSNTGPGSVASFQSSPGYICVPPGRLPGRAPVACNVATLCAPCNLHRSSAGAESQCGHGYNPRRFSKRR